MCPPPVGSRRQPLALYRLANGRSSLARRGGLLLLIVVAEPASGAITWFAPCRAIVKGDGSDRSARLAFLRDQNAQIGDWYVDLVAVVVPGLNVPLIVVVLVDDRARALAHFDHSLLV